MTIKTVEQIYKLSLKRKSLMSNHFLKPIPAAFLINFPAVVLIGWIKFHNFKIYVKKNK